MAQLQVLGSGYMGTVSTMRNEPQSSRRAHGKHRGNKVKLPSWRGHAIEVLAQSRVASARAARMSPREQKVAQNLQAARITAASLPSITEGRY